MIFTTGSTLTIAKTLPETDLTAYTTGQVSLHVTSGNVTKIYGCVVTPRDPGVLGAILTASSVDTTAEGLYILRFVEESAADLDTNGITITAITSATLRKVVDAGITVAV